MDINGNYERSRISVSGGNFSMFSSEMRGNGENLVAVIAGINVINWWGGWGAEGSIKSKVGDVKAIDGQNISPLNLEARMHRRWSLPWNPLPESGAGQVSAFGAYEHYRNSGNGAFSPRYDLLKGGLTLDFPFFRSWDTGGEVVFGYGKDRSKKYELSGHLNYNMKGDWSLGIGYRLHFFEAGSDETSPLGVPYREGFGEGYSVLSWHY